MQKSMNDIAVPLVCEVGSYYGNIHAIINNKKKGDKSSYSFPVNLAEDWLSLSLLTDSTYRCTYQKIREFMTHSQLGCFPCYILLTDLLYHIFT